MCLRPPHHHADFFRVADVAGIDAQLIDARVQGHQGKLVLKVNVRNQDGFGAALADFRQRLGGLLIGHGQADDFAPSGFHLLDLRDRLLHFARVRLGHRLDGNGGVSADRQASDLDRAGFSSRWEEFGITEIHKQLLEAGLRG